jgi:hypothetical protein
MFHIRALAGVLEGHRVDMPIGIHVEDSVFVKIPSLDNVACTELDIDPDNSRVKAKGVARFQ